VLEILLVEDDANDAELALRSLKNAHVLNPVVHARDGREALALLADRAGEGRRFGLVLLDLHMPGMNGLEVLERVKSDPFLASTSVVVLTSGSTDPIIARCYALGANGFAQKPVRFDSCHEVVKQLHLSWLMVSPPPDSVSAGFE